MLGDTRMYRMFEIESEQISFEMRMKKKDNDLK